MVHGTTLRLVVVTPEKTLLDESVSALRLPLYDGSMGILPGRAPLLGRLGHGELRITTPAGERRYFIDGGFVQVKGSVVSLLTNRALRAEDINVPQAQEHLQRVQAQVPTTPEAFAAKAQDQERTRRMLAVARGPRS